MISWLQNYIQNFFWQLKSVTYRGLRRQTLLNVQPKHARLHYMFTCRWRILEYILILQYSNCPRDGAIFRFCNQELNPTAILACCSHYILSLSHKHTRTHINLHSASLIGNVDDELCFVSLSSVFISSVAVSIAVSLLLSCIAAEHLSGDPAERISSCCSACGCWRIIRCHWGRNLKGLQIHKRVTHVKWC